MSISVKWINIIYIKYCAKKSTITYPVSLYLLKYLKLICFVLLGVLLDDEFHIIDPGGFRYSGF